MNRHHRTRKVLSAFLSLALALTLTIPGSLLGPAAWAAAPDPGWTSVEHTALTYSAGWTDAGTGHNTSTIAAYCEYTYTGRGIKLVAPTGPNMGIANVYLDGVFAGAVDLYAATAAAADVVFTSADLGDGTHTARVVCTGDKNPSSTGTAIAVAQIYYEDPTGAPIWTTVGPFDPGIAYNESTGWNIGDPTNETTTFPGSYYTYTFTGNKVGIYNASWGDRGICDIYIDGARVDTVDFRQGSQSLNVRWESGILASGTHTLKVVLTDTYTGDGGGPKLNLLGLRYSSDGGATWTEVANSQITLSSVPTSAGWDTTKHATAMYTNVPGAYATGSFTGTRYSVLLGAWSGRGQAQIYVDGNLNATVSENSNGDFWYDSGTFPNGTHTFKLLYIGNGSEFYFSGFRYDDGSGSWTQIPAASFRASFTWSAKHQWASNNSNSYNMVYAQTGDAGASFTYAFSGTGIAWLADKASGRGTASVSIDGGAPVTVSQNSAAAVPNGQIFQQTGLTQGPHTITVTCDGAGTIVNCGMAVIAPYVPPAQHALNIKAYEGGSITAGTAGNYAPGAAVNISARPDANYDFIGWYALNGSASMFGNANSPDTTFTMPASDVTVVALFSLASANIYKYADLDTAAYDLGANGDRVADAGSATIGTAANPASTKLFPLSNVKMTVNGFPIKVYNQAQGVVNSTSLQPVRLARFQMPADQPVEIVITWPEKVNSVSIYPLQYNIKAFMIDDYSFKFTLQTPLKVRVDVNGVYNGVCVFPDPLEQNAPKLGGPGVTNVMDFIGADYLARTAATNAYGDTPDINDKNFPNCTKAFQAAIDAVSASYNAAANPSPVLYVPDGVYRLGTIYIKSHVNLYFSNGAVLLAGTRVQGFTGTVTSAMNPATANNNFDIAYDYQSDQPAVRAWIRAVDASDFKLFGRGILDGNGRYFQNSTDTNKNKRLIGLYFNGGAWNPATGKPYILSNQAGQMPGPAAEGDSQNAAWMSQYGNLKNTHDFEVDDLLLFDSWFYNSSVDSCYNGTFNNFKVNSTYLEGSGRNEQDGFKIDGSSNITFDDGWLIAGDDPFTIAACGPTAFGDATGNAVKNTIFNPENAGYVRFAFVEHGFTYYNNLLNNIYCIDSPTAYEVFKGESYGGYQYDTLLRDNTFSDWYIDGTHKLLQLGMSYQTGFRYKGLTNFNFDRIILDAVNNSSEVKNQYADAPTQVKFTDLMAGGEYIDNMADAGIHLTPTTPQGPMEVDFAVTGNPWVKVLPGTVDGLAVGQTANSASFTFTGSQVRWYATKSAGGGTATVFIDNRQVAAVNLDGAGNGPEIVYESGDLGATRHTITVVYSGGTVNCDAFEFLKSLPANAWQDVTGGGDTSVVYSDGWVNQGNSYTTGVVSAYGDYTFVGSAFKVLARTGPDMGMANIYIDGSLVSTVDLYSAAAAGPVTVYKSSGRLWDARHTARIVCTGQENPLSTGTTVNVASVQQMPAQWTDVPANSADTYTFVGAGVRWIGDKGPGGGIANVYIDGKLAATVDTGAASAQTGVILFEAANLQPDEHTVTIETVSGTVTSLGIQHLNASWSFIPPNDPNIKYSGPGWTVSNSNEWRASDANVWVEYTAAGVTSLAYLASSWGDRGWAQITVTDSNGNEINYGAYNIIRNNANNVNGYALNQVDTSLGTAGSSVGGQAVMWQVTGLPPGTYTIHVLCMYKAGSGGNTQINFLGFAYSADSGSSPVMTRVAPGTAASPGPGIIPSGFADGRFWQSEEANSYLTAKLGSSGEYAWFEYRFKGSSIAWLNRGLAGRPNADIYLDGTKVATYAESTGSATVGRVFEMTGLDPAKEHTLRVYATYDTGSGSGERWFTNYGLEAIVYPDANSSYRLDSYAPVGGSVTIGGGSESYDAASGDVFHITAAPDPGYKFAGWTALCGQGDRAVFADAASAATDLTMPAGDVTLIAQFTPTSDYIRFTYNNEAAAEIISGERLTIEAAFADSDNTPQTLIAALYNKAGTVTGLAKTEGVVGNGSVEFTANLDIPAGTQAGAYVKIFVWNTQTYAPLRDSYMFP